MKTAPSPWEARVHQALARLEAALHTPGDPRVSNRMHYFQYVATHLLRFGEDRHSPIPSMLAHVGNYWCSGILAMLHSGGLRPSEIRKALCALTPDHPISQRMLTLNLRALERDGLIRREVRHSGRAHVEYGLTQMGQDLSALMFSIIHWAADNVENITSARAAFADREDS